MTDIRFDASGTWWLTSQVPPGEWSITRHDGTRITDADLGNDTAGQEAAAKHLEYIKSTRLRWHLSQLEGDGYIRFQSACEDFFGLSIKNRGSLHGTPYSLNDLPDRGKPEDTSLWPDLTILDVQRGMRIALLGDDIREPGYIVPALRFAPSEKDSALARHERNLTVGGWKQVKAEEWVSALADNRMPGGRDAYARLGVRRMRVKAHVVRIYPIPDLRSEGAECKVPGLWEGHVLVWNTVHNGWTRLWSDLGYVRTSDLEVYTMPTPTPAPKKPYELITSMWVKENGVRVRSGPGISFSIVDTLSRGDMVKVIGLSQMAEGYHWHRFTHQGIDAYIAREFLAEFTVRKDQHRHTPHPALIEAVRGTKLDTPECVRALMAIAITESGARTAVDNGGDLVHRFEPAQWDKLFSNRLGPTPPDEWTVEKCYVTSWGVGQIMGWGHDPQGFPDALSFKRWMEKDPANEYKALVVFCLKKAGVAGYIRNKDWENLWVAYNGGHPHWITNFRAALDRVDMTTTDDHQTIPPKVIPVYHPPKPTSVVRRAEQAIKVRDDDHEVKAAVKGTTATSVKWLAGGASIGLITELAAVLLPQLEQGLLTTLIALMTAGSTAVAEPPAVASVSVPEPAPIVQEVEPVQAPQAMPTLIPVELDYALYVVAVRNANVRSAPAPDAPVIGQLREGTEVGVIEELEGWLRIGQEQWLHNSVADMVQADG